jgi:toxin ParE1/3/4
VKINWTDAAIAHLSSINDYVSEHSPGRAARLTEKILDRSVQFATFAYSGRMVPEFRRADVREVIEGSYRIIYRILPAQIDVVAVIHVRQDFPERLFGLS